MYNQILQGDALATLKTLPDNYIQTCVTSPPYYNLRDYGCDEQIGLEETPEQYVEKLTAVFREVRRVLRRDGVAFVNLGDSYGANKQLLGIPWRTAFSLQADGWVLRQDLIWQKPNTLPESVKDRCTKSHEYVFLLAKSQKYFYDADAIREETKPFKPSGTKYTESGHKANHLSMVTEYNPLGRNKRSVWSIPTIPFSGAHFAVMPPELARLCILAGSSDKACEHCGKAWERVTEHTPMVISHGPYGSRTTDGLSGTMVSPAETRTIGFEPGCMCDNIGSAKSIVLDPFSGAGTTAYVASKLGRQYIGIELNPQYVELSQKRLANLATGLWGFDEEIA